MKVRCEKCNREIDTKGIANHIKACKGTIDQVPMGDGLTDDTVAVQKYGLSKTSVTKLTRLDDFLCLNFKDELASVEGNTAIDIAISLLTKLKEGHIPLSKCPYELKHLRENTFRYYLVGGRNVGGWLVVEDVKFNK